MTVLLTGGGGFLGGRVAAELLAGERTVRLLIRDPERAADLTPGCEIAKGDLRDADALDRALAGCDAVVHLAAVVKRWARPRAVFDQVNVEGSRRLFEIAELNRVAKTVYVSSFLALGPTDGGVGDEDTIHDHRPRNDYERTKLLADAWARRRQAAGAPIVIVYPGVVYGPGRVTDGNILAAAARQLLDGRLPGIVGAGDRRWCFSYVDDVARGVVLALERAAPGSRYVLGGENLTLAGALSLIADLAGIPAPRRRIPYALATGIGWALRRWADVTGMPPALTDEEVAIYRREWAYSSARAQRDLGYTVTPAREGFRRLVDWLAAGGDGAPPRAGGARP